MVHGRRMRTWIGRALAALLVPAGALTGTALAQGLQTAPPSPWAADLARARQEYVAGRITPAVQAMRQAIEGAGQRGDLMGQVDLAQRASEWCLRASDLCVQEFQRQAFNLLRSASEQPQLRQQLAASLNLHHLLCALIPSCQGEGVRLDATPSGLPEYPRK